MADKEIPNEVLIQAKEIIAEKYADPNGIHTVMIGFREVNGKETDEPAIVCLTENKMSAFKMKASGVEPVPSFIEIQGYKVPTDVQEEDKPQIAKLRISPDELEAQAVTSHRQCHNAPMPGGLQIAPAGKQWVGTLGLAVELEGGKFGAITNAHVTDLRGVGNKMLQPGPGYEDFGTVIRVVGIRFDGQANYIDAAVIDTLKTGGKYGAGCHTVKPEQLEIGRITPRIKKPALGDLVWKSGRTTGVTKGRCTGIEATTYVGYEEGSAKFERQNYYKNLDGGDFSAGGDSGSFILTMQNEGHGLLFAGGGGSTVDNPIEFVLDWAKAKLFELR